MDLDRKYELGEVIVNDGESKTFRAREIATGREVFVHIIYGGRGQGREPLLNSVLQRSMDPSPEKRRQIFEIDDHKGMPYAVTEVLPDFRGLRQWIERDRMPEQPPAAEPDRHTRAARWQVPAFRPTQPHTPGGAPGAAQPGDFTQAFGGPPSGQEQPPPEQPSPSFTGLFRATVGETRKMPAVVPQPPAAQPPAPPAAPAVRPPAAPPPAAPAPPAPAQPGSGEFTMLFGKSPIAAPEPEQAPPPQPPVMPPPVQPAAAPASLAPESPGQAAVGEFTMLFGKSPFGGSEQETSAPPVAAHPPVPPPAAPPVASAAPPRTAQPEPSPAQAGVGEFTMLFGKSPFATPEAPAAAEWGSTPPQAAPPSPPLSPSSPGNPPSPFTALFQATTAPQPPGHVPMSAPPAPPKHAPGEFTSLFSSPPQSGQEEFGAPVPMQPKPAITGPPTPSGPPGAFPPPAPAAPARPSSEFTKYFADAPAAGKPTPQAPFAPTAPQQPSSATGAFSISRQESPAAPAAPPLAGVPGEYTRMFGSPTVPGAPGGGMPPAAGGGGFPGFGPPAAPPMQAPPMPGMQMPGMQPPGMQMPGMQMPGMQAPQAPQMQMPQAGMPGMQMPGMQAPQAPGMQMPAAAPAPAAGGGKGLLLLVVILAALFILALATIGYLLVKK